MVPPELTCKARATKVKTSSDCKSLTLLYCPRKYTISMTMGRKKEMKKEEERKKGHECLA